MHNFSSNAQRVKVVISLLIHQGLTSKEITRIRMKDVDIDAGTIYVMASKGIDSRTLELHRTQYHLFITYISEIRPVLRMTSTDRFVIGGRGEAYTVDAINRMLRQLKHLFPDRKLNAQTIRQSVISNWLNERKLPIDDVQLMAGHHYPSSTEKYKQMDMNAMREKINQFHPLG